MFKKLASKFALPILIATALSGCTYTSEVDYGKQFTAEQVSQIKKNITTTSDLISIFGEPVLKSVLSETDEKWIYTYTGGTASAQVYTAKVKSNISTHMLDILISSDVVVNFAETNSQQNMNSSIK
jgi:outer membrane protein assembly factor BamE (lipoprotein component of BamABCDE complex)|tara:strand:+ start:81 stop:458 length:378 start_codon:yes stop_codon:yes gene_type:complete